MIRVGTCKYDKKGNRTDPSYPNFTPIIVLMKSHSEYGELGPYDLKNDKNQIFENIYQFQKVYKKIPSATQYYSRWSNQVIWKQNEETHIDQKTGETNDAYWKWRNRGINNEYYVRYPCGYNYRHNVEYTLWLNSDGKYEKLDYIQARKKIYVKEYIELVKNKKKFKELQNRLKKGENLLIIEVDGPHGEIVDYYKEKYNVHDNFIENDTMLVTQENIKIMLNDSVKPFGHGYSLAMALLEKGEEWNV